MPRWPFRQIDSINKTMEDLHDQLDGARTEADRARYDQEKKTHTHTHTHTRIISHEYVRGDSPRIFVFFGLPSIENLWGLLFVFFRLDEGSLHTQFESYYIVLIVLFISLRVYESNSVENYQVVPGT